MESFKSLSIWTQRAILGGLGAVAGFGYYHYVGCASGTCAITSNPYISTAYGMLMGTLLVNNRKTTAQGGDATGNNNKTSVQ